tara:strand:- start:5315 stop:11746 length:6432 start_codon:yes stop_codon:yes gene_type:complete
LTSNKNDNRADDLKRALLAIRQLREKVTQLESQAAEPVAIVGQSCRLPGGADTPEKLWELLQQGADATCEVPKERWDADAIYNPDPEAVGGAYVKRGGFLREPVDEFDPGFFGISPREASAMDPMHRLLLELAWEALEDAGIPPFGLEESLTGVFVGMSVSDYDVIQQGTGLSNIHSYRGTGTIASIAAGRISHFLGLQGPNFPVDTACSSGLVALVLAVEQLRQKKCNLALVGAANMMLSPEATIFLCRMRALDADGRCRTFDESASGYSRGEGAGMLALKRLSDATADGDRVLAVIRGVACNHDGHSSGLTVPNPNAQRKVIARALADAGIDPLVVDYIEAHGTATQLGDPIELRALSAVLCQGREASNPLRLGAIKTNMGHLEAAAGITGVLKVIQSLQHRQIPASLHCETPTSHFDWAGLPLRVNTELSDWDSALGPRTAGVSAFGFSGTNAHVILEEAPQAVQDGVEARPVNLVAVSAKSANAARELATKYSDALSDSGDDLAVASTSGRSHMDYRLVAVGESETELRQSLQTLQQDDAYRALAADSVQIAMLFTGQGSQSVGMAHTLWHSAPVFRDALQRCADIVDAHLDTPLLELLVDGDDKLPVTETRYAQPALFAFEYALYCLWQSWGVEPSVVMGHSLGEYVAATIAGVMSLEDALPLVATRGRLMHELESDGRMIAVFADRDVVESMLADYPQLSIAAENGVSNFVVSGNADDIGRFTKQAEEKKLVCSELVVSQAFHSALMDPMLEAFDAALKKVTFSAPQIPLVSNVDGQFLSDKDAVDAGRWRKHVRDCVMFRQSIETIRDHGISACLEIGPHPVLCSLGQDVPGTSDMQWVASLVRGKQDWTQLASALGELYRHGYDPDWDAWNSAAAGRRAGGPSYPFQRDRFWFTDLLEGEAGAKVRQPRKQLSSIDHPLLDTELTSPAIDGFVFATHLDADFPAFLADHRILGKIVAPAAMYIEMIAAAVREGLDWNRIRMQSLRFERPLLIDEDLGRVCQVILQENGSDEYSVKIVSAADHDGVRSEWLTHVSGTVTCLPDTESSQSSDLDEKLPPAANKVDIEALYAGLELRRIDYGPQFRTLKNGRIDGDRIEATASLQSESALDGEHYIAHPAQLDAGFQALAGFEKETDDASSTWLPSVIDEVVYRAPLPAECTLRASFTVDESGAEAVANINFYNDQGERCVEFGAYRSARVDESLLSRAIGVDVADLVYDIDWEPFPLPELQDEAHAGQRFLVLADSHDKVSALGPQLEAAGISVDIVRSSGAALSDSLPDDVRYDGVVYGWALNAAATEDSAATAIVDDIVNSQLSLLSVLKAGVLADTASITLLTEGALGPGLASPSHWHSGAAIASQLSVIQAEMPACRCRAIDLDPGIRPDAMQLSALILGDAAEDRVAIREGQACVARLQHPSGQAHDPDRRLPPAGANYRIAIAERGTLDAIEYRAADRPEPGAGDVEIRIRATGLNFRDVLNVLGMYPGDPGPPGVEIAGEVVRKGSAVSHVDVGDRVFGLANSAFAAYTTTPADGVARIPDVLSYEEAATIPLAFLTAEWGLANLAKMRKGDRVLIHAAAGGVGQAAVQLALAAGATVYATVSSDEKRAFLESQGVSNIYSSREAAFADEVLRDTDGEGVDIVLNALTGEMLQRSLALLNGDGRFVELGKAEVLDDAVLAEEWPGVSYFAFDLGSVLIETPKVFRDLFESVLQRFGAGILRPLRVRTFLADQVVAAFRYMAQARHIGKVVVTSAMRVSDEGTLRDGTYLVTGASGYIASELATWLAEKGASRLLLTARSEYAPEKHSWVQDLVDRGIIVDWVAGDISEQGFVEGLLADDRFSSAPLRGIFHTAGVLQDAMLTDVADADLRNVLAPKLRGAWLLHQLSQSHDLEHFVLYSSVAAQIGGAGQSSYAAANAAISALAERRRRSGLPAIAIEWGAWGDGGMAQSLSDTERSLLKQRGMDFLSTQDALEVTSRLLHDEVNPRVLVARFEWSKIRARSGEVAPFLSRLMQDASVAGQDAGGTGVHLDLEDFAQLGDDERLEKVTEFLASLLEAVVGARPSQLAPDTKLGDLGFDSLMAMEIRNRLEKGYGVAIPVSTLLGSADLAALVRELDTLFLSVASGDSGGSTADDWEEGEI